jgi:hypothetical protein
VLFVVGLTGAVGALVLVVALGILGYAALTREAPGSASGGSQRGASGVLGSASASTAAKSSEATEASVPRAGGTAGKADDDEQAILKARRPVPDGGKPTDARTPEDRALDLLGGVADVGLLWGRGIHSISGAQEIPKIFPRLGESLMHSTQLRKRLREVAEELGKLDTNNGVCVVARLNPEFAEVRALLGGEEKTRVDYFLVTSSTGGKGHEILSEDQGGSGGKPVTWYRYGWLEWGVVEGKVYAIRAACPPAKTEP